MLVNSSQISTIIIYKTEQEAQPRRDIFRQRDEEMIDRTYNKLFSQIFWRYGKRRLRPCRKN